MSRVRVISEPFDAEAFSAWASIWDLDSSATLFQHPDWAEVSIPSLPSSQLFLLLGESEALALRIEDGVLKFLCDPEVTDYAGPVSFGDIDLGAAAFVEAMADLNWRTADLDGLIGGEAWVDAFTKEAKAKEWSVTVSEVDVSPGIALDGDFDAYMASLASKQRHEIRRKGRRLEREISPWTTRITTPETLAEDLEFFFSLHRLSDGDKGQFMTPQHEALFRRAAGVAAREGWLRLSWLETDVGKLASVFTFAVGDTWLVWNSAFDPAYRNLSVGMIAMAEQIRLACEAGAKRFDLLRGNESYKYRLGCQDRSVVAIRIER